MKKVRKMNLNKTKCVQVQFNLKQQRRFTEFIKKDTRILKEKAKSFDQMCELDKICLKTDLLFAGLGHLVYSDEELEALNRFNDKLKKFYHGK